MGGGSSLSPTYFKEETTMAEVKQKMVKVRIPRTKADQEDVFVSVNLRTYLIKRGVEVEVPDFVAEVLRHQEEMMEEIMLFEEQVQKGK
jgi:hypothetical protein